MLHNRRANNEVDSSEEGSEDEEVGDTSTPEVIVGDYDQTLPGQHSYLGLSNQLSGRTILDTGNLQKLPLLCLPGFILMPNQVFPLQVIHPSVVSLLQSLITTTKTFGMVSLTGEQKKPLLSWRGAIGTTAEIIEYSDTSSDDAETVGFKIKAKGRQRFRLISINKDLDGHLVGNVAILPEVQLHHPLHSARLRSCDKLAKYTFTPSPSPSSTHPRECQVSIEMDKINVKALSRFPPWLYLMYNAKALAQRVQAALLECGMGGSSTGIPSDPETLSWWVAVNLPLTDKQKHSLLCINNNIHRLRAELALLAKCRILACRSCQTKLADQQDIFSLSSEGPQGAFINAGGHLHETLTLYRADNLNLVGSPSTEYSWFPGYAWTIIECSSCLHHIGWRFTATKPTMRPSSFYGFSRKSISANLVATDSGSGNTTEESDEEVEL